MNILIADDGSEIPQLLEKSLNDWNHTVYFAESGKEIQEKISSVPVDVVIGDWMKPEMGAADLCSGIRDGEFDGFIYFILVAARDAQGEIVHGLESGADDFITKPIRLDELKSRIEIGARIVQLEREAISRYDDLKKNYIQTISMFTSLIEVFDEDLGGHCRRVGKLCFVLAKRHPDVSEKDYVVAEGAGLLHDIGMIGLPGEILSKKRTERNDDERQHYLTHPARGEIILNEIEFLNPIAKLVRAHHEQFNGRGFPDGLAGAEIPVLAMIVSAASIYDNFVHRGSVPLEDMPANLQRMRGYQLEPFVLDLLLEINLENIQEEAEKDFLGISLNDLKEGMVLATEIRMKTGALAMPSGTELTAYGIEKLNRYRNLESITDRVFVYKSTIRG
jgi:response regulator RpfG family c-di-GMP phosphodiesterase